MTNLEEIENAVSSLSPESIAEFRAWFEIFDAQQWDNKISLDAENGNLDEVVRQSIDDYNAGKISEL